MRKIICILLTLLILLLALSACNNKATQATNSTELKLQQISGDMNTVLAGNNSFQKTAENEKYILLINGATAEAVVKEKATGFEWSTNPKMKDGLTDEQKTLAFSQFELESFDSTDKQTIFNSYRDSVSLNQISYSKATDGIQVNYVVGKTEKIYLVPQIIEKSRLEKFASKMDSDAKSDIMDRYNLITIKDLNAKDKEAVLKQYPQAKNNDIYVMISEFPDYILEEIDIKFQNAGYTFEDLTLDNTQNNVPTKEKAVNYSVSIIYTLTNKGLSVTVPYDQIKTSNSKYFLTSINLLPAFGCGTKSDSGYIFVPDGSGAIINFNNNKSGVGSYNLDVYGKDNSIDWLSQPVSEKQCFIPVYGMKNGNHAFVSIIESGDAFATINASTANQTNPFNMVNSSFKLRSYDRVNVSITTDVLVNKYSAKQMNEDIKIQYDFLDNENSNYSSMAKTYQKFLVDKGSLSKSEKKDIRLKLGLIGAIDYKKSVLGIPVDAIKPITTYENALTIAGELYKSGVSNTSIQFFAWQNGGINYTKGSSIGLINELGGENSFKKLIKNAGNFNATIYPNNDIVYTKNPSLFSGYIPFNLSARFLSNEFAKKYDYNVSTKRADSNYPILSPKVYNEYSKSYLKDMQKFKMTALSLDTAGTDLNSDFSTSKVFTRKDTKDEIIKLLEEYKKQNIRLMTNGANAYTYPFATEITDIPEKSSEHYLIDKSVPFLQMVLHGFKEISSEPLNLSSDYNNEVLRLAEYGVSPSFLWTYSPNDTFKSIDYDLYGTYYKVWFERAVATYQQLSNDFKDMVNVPIANHEEIGSNVFKTTYENGALVFVNYNNKDITVDNVTMKAKSYMVKKGGS